MEEGEGDGKIDITDKTDAKALTLRRTIYLTIMSRYSHTRACTYTHTHICTHLYVTTVWTMKNVLTNY